MADDTVPRCGCGCGHPVVISRKTGKPNRFLYHHYSPTFSQAHQGRLREAAARRVPKAEIKRYRQVKSTDSGSTLVHRRRAELALGHSLPPHAVIHHPDEDPWNPNARLVICPDQKYHFLLHRRMRVKAAGGDPNTDKICSHCREVKPKMEFGSKRPNPDGLNDSCRVCTNERMRKIHQCRRDARQAQPHTHD